MPDSTKSLVLNGDKDAKIETIENIYKHSKIVPFSFKSKGKKPKIAADGALYIESLDSKRNLQDTDSCLEFLLLSFCQSFEISPKKAAGLLIQNNKYLAHLIVKGLRGDHYPIFQWYSSLLLNFDKLLSLIQNEIAKGSINLILSAVKPGLLSKNVKTVELTTEVIFFIIQRLNNENPLLFEWFCKEGLEACVVSIGRLKDSIGDFIAKIFLAFKNQQFFEIVSERLNKFEEKPAEFLKILMVLYRKFAEQREKFHKSGVLDYYFNYCLRDSEVLKISDTKVKLDFNICRINALCMI